MVPNGASQGVVTESWIKNKKLPCEDQLIRALPRSNMQSHKKLMQIIDFSDSHKRFIISSRYLYATNRRKTSAEERLFDLCMK